MCRNLRTFLGVKFGLEDLLRVKDLTFRNSVIIIFIMIAAVFVTFPQSCNAKWTCNAIDDSHEPSNNPNFYLCSPPSLKLTSPLGAKKELLSELFEKNA